MTKQTSIADFTRRTGAPLVVSAGSAGISAGSAAASADTVGWFVTWILLGITATIGLSILAVRFAARIDRLNQPRSITIDEDAFMSLVHNMSEDEINKMFKKP